MRIILLKQSKALDQGKYGCGIFVDLQNALDTVDHDILMGKLKHFGVYYRGTYMRCSL